MGGAVGHDMPLTQEMLNELNKVSECDTWNNFTSLYKNIFLNYFNFNQFI